jgi:ribonuclease BN (tRNA processing enzyme)
MRLSVLGAGPAYTSRPDAAGAAYLVTHEGTRLLLDLGQGAFPRIFAHLLPADLDAVVISHLHPDHFIDLVALRHYLRYEFDPPRRLRVIGPHDLAARLDALHAEPGFTRAALDCEDLRPGPERIGTLTVEARPVAHTPDSQAVRVASADAPGLVYSGDCGRSLDLVPLVRPGDTLLVEVAFGAGPVPPGVLHLDGPAVGELAALTHPSRVLLTHVLAGRDLDATLAAVRGRWDGPVRFVWPGDELPL